MHIKVKLVKKIKAKMDLNNSIIIIDYNIACPRLSVSGDD